MYFFIISIIVLCARVFKFLSMLLWDTHTHITIFLGVHSLSSNRSSGYLQLPATTNAAATDNLILLEGPKLSFSFGEIIIYLVKDELSKQV